jgi:putative methionine-R-sulfoxide reductase with GAF domain/alkylhydroperoxidase family enzyme
MPGAAQQHRVLGARNRLADGEFLVEPEGGLIDDIVHGSPLFSCAIATPLARRLSAAGRSQDIADERIIRTEFAMTPGKPEPSKPETYRELARQLAALLEGATDPVANAANMAALIYHGLPDLNWAGFYFRKGNALVLGPFQGKPACVQIPIGQGVCGAAAAQGVAVAVADVGEFPGHIACDPNSRSELVVPLIEDGAVWGVLDLDSPSLARFDEADRDGCERLVAILLEHHRGAAPGDRADIDPQSGCRLPLPRREELDAEAQQTYDRLADPAGGSLRGLRGPGGIQLHSPELSRRSRPLNHYLRNEAGLGGRVRELAILATAREHDSRFEWAAHQGAALAEGISPEIIDLIRWRSDVGGLAEADAIVIALGRAIFSARRVSATTYARALRQFGRKKLVDLVALMGNYAATAALLTAFDTQPDDVGHAAALPQPFFSGR